ncbi:transglycosylase domain-containing protein [Anaerovoracaceae bacterium SGI.195]
MSKIDVKTEGKILKSSEVKNDNSQARKRESAKSGKSHDNDYVAEDKKKPDSKKMKLWKKILLIVLAFILITVIIAFAYIAYVVHGAEKINTDNLYSILSESSVIYDDQGNKIDSIYATENRTNINYKDLPENLKDAFISIEDKTFWKHHGFNYVRILGAIKDSLSSGRVSGTSTITQQLARNIFLKESKSERSIKRKIIEAYYTVIIEKNMSKKQILEAYLNTIYLGNNSNGVEAASQAYFSKGVSELNLVESAALAALPKAPTEYAYVRFVNLSDAQTYDDDHILHKTTSGAYILNDAGLDRVHLCLKLMREQNKISQKEYEEAVKVPLKDVINPNFSLTSSKSAYFNDYVIEEVVNDFAKKYNLSKSQAREKIYDGGLKIYSTLDSQAQSVIETEFSNNNNFPSPIDMSRNAEGNFIDKNGNVALYNYSNYFDKAGNYILNSDEAWENDDGSITLAAGKKLNFYDTSVNGKADISVEFKSMFINSGGELYVISGGFVNIPQGEKKKDKDGNTTISAKFVRESKNWFNKNDDGTISISANAYTLNQQVVQPQAAMTIVDVNTGAVKAMVGGRNTEGRDLFNRASSPRQPGSAIKPIGVYAPALQQSADEAKSGRKHNFRDLSIDKQGSKYWGDYLTSGSVIIDEPTRIDGKDWPKNFDKSYMGPIDLKTALALSRNTTSVKTYFQVGGDYCMQMLEKFGITTIVKDGEINDNNPSAIALGGMAKGISPLELTNAYSAFANGGLVHKTHAYSQVKDRKGKVILENKSDAGSRVLGEDVAFIMNKILQYSVTSGFGGPAALPGVPVGAKTGTTNDDMDIWCAGITPSYAAALWIGNDVAVSLSQSSRAASVLWGQIMRQIQKAYNGSFPSQPSDVISIGDNYFVKGTETGLSSKDKIKSEFDKKESIVVNICKDSGMLATPWCTHIVRTTFEKGTEDKIPKTYCPIHNKDTKKYPLAPGTAAPEQNEEKPEVDDHDKPEQPSNPEGSGD